MNKFKKIYLSVFQVLQYSELELYAKGFLAAIDNKL